jgi:DNA primase
MDYRRNGRRRQVPASLYSEAQVEATITKCGIDIITDTTNDFICLCPFHGNTNTPSFSVSKASGKYLCFNESCAESGSLIELVKALLKKNDFEAARLINKAKTESMESFADRFKKAVTSIELPSFSKEVLDRMKKQFWDSPRALEYMHGRGFEDGTLEEYNIGYSEKKDLIAVPMYSETGEPVGVIGRTIKDKRFRNSDKLPVRQTLWNIHRARRTGDTVIVCEASFDAMLISQAGYPNVVACLGGNFNDAHAHQLAKYFDKIIIFTDWDDSREHKYDRNGKRCRACVDAGFMACKGHNPGRDIGQKIVDAMKGKKVLWASYGHKQVYARGVKDAGDMTSQEIRQCVKNAVSNLEYQRWNLYYHGSLAADTASMV